MRNASTMGSQRIYQHPDRRCVVIHFHRGNLTLTPYEIRNLLLGTDWTKEDPRRATGVAIR
ncbi:MAG: hypothetical protein HYZ72_17760 [Deltaproteobacteria bacterium]|nr:hypothetical protein [Deltaproteobacteria bacterium]